MFQEKTTALYECPRTSSNKSSFVDIDQVRINQINSHPHRQQKAISYLLKMGDTANQTVIDSSKEIWKVLLKKNITISAKYLPTGSHKIPETSQIGNCAL